MAYDPVLERYEYFETEYFSFTVPEIDYEWCYSAKNLENRLRKRLIGDRIKKIFVSCRNYENPLTRGNEFVDYYLGSQVLLETERTYADIQAHAAGLFQIRFFNASEVKRETFYGIPDDIDDSLCDTGCFFTSNYTYENIVDINVVSTETPAYCPETFDYSKIGEPAELPEKIEFTLSNETSLTIWGLDDDFIIKIEQI